MYMMYCIFVLFYGLNIENLLQKSDLKQLKQLTHFTKHIKQLTGYKNL